MDNHTLNRIREEKDDAVDFNLIFHKIKKNWYFFLITLIVAIGTAYLFNQYSNPLYEVSTTVLIKNSSNGPSTNRLIGLNLSGGYQNIENEIALLRSYKLAKRTTKSIGFEVSYYQEKNFIRKEVYGDDVYFNVEFDSTHPQLAGVPFEVKPLSDSAYQLRTESINFVTYRYDNEEETKHEISYSIDTTHAFNQWLTTPYFRFKLNPNPSLSRIESREYDFEFVFNTYSGLIKRYRGIRVEPLNRESSVISISMRDANIKKAEAFLNQLTKMYLAYDLENKNKTTRQTIDFIEEQLEQMQDTLKKTEELVGKYRKKAEILDIDRQTQTYLEEISKMQSEYARWKTKKDIYGYARKYLKQTDSESHPHQFLPGALGIEDPVYIGLLQRLHQLHAELTELRFNSKQEHVLLQKKQRQIESTKRSIAENLNSNIAVMEISMRNIDKNIDSLFRRMNKLPKAQRELYAIEKQFRLLDNTYTWLLQRRSDAQITKASNLPDNEIIDRADENNIEKVFPKNILNYAVALIVALLLPLAFIFGKDYLNDKITDREHLQPLLEKASVIGEIINNRYPENLVVRNHPKSAIAETFRKVRTQLEFVVRSQQKAVILVSSHFPGEGKTFISENLALSYALYGKKTVLLGFDLRKPKIYGDFNINNLKGLSTYLSNKNSLEEVIQHTDMRNFDLIMAGPVPPNPAELIASEKTFQLMKVLRQEYDYIIIDTPPVGLVTDAMLLLKHADSSIFVGRSDFSRAKLFAQTVNEITDQNIPNVHVVINDVNSTVEGKYSKYGYGYYSDDFETEKPSFWKKLMEK
ncbi:MAG: GumC family protein [Bacteroidota bacterium]